jgi:predicted acyl esterase
LINLWENGFAERLSDGIVRARFHNGMSKQELAQPGAVYGYHIDAWNTCEMFKAGPPHSTGDLVVGIPQAFA